MKTTVTGRKSGSKEKRVDYYMSTTPKGLISVLIFGNENFPVLPAPFQCMVHTTIKGADEYLTKVPVDVIYVGVSDADPSLTNNLTAMAKLSPSSALVALVKDYPQAELAFATGAADCILTEKLTVDVVTEKARFVIARMRYLRHGGGNHLYTYSDLAAIARVLSHDIRNSLSGIVLSLEPIRQACENNEDAKSYVDILDRSSTKLNQVVNRFSLATGNIALKATEGDFNNMVRHAIATLPNNALKDARLTENYSALNVMIPFDKEKIPTAITNLITNAVDALEGHPNGEIRITTEIDKESATLFIQDNGHGIDYTTLQNIFRPFFTTRPGKAGLGLPIAYSIMSAHGAALRINSNSGGGTEVVCRFPLKK
jgi:signal transduction histidine kinase